ncbi:MAG: hypothetical protein ACUVT4_06870 [Actinomycetota bacterium]
MRKLMAVFLGVALVAALLALVGCGGKETTIKTPEGEVTVKEGEGGKVTIRGEEGEITYESSDRAPSEEELGAPIYPGADYVEGTSGMVTGTSEGKEVTTAGAQFTTDDDIDEVISWYRGKLGAPTYENTSPREATWMMSKEDSMVTISVTEEEGKTSIQIARISGTR